MRNLFPRNKKNKIVFFYILIKFLTHKSFIFCSFNNLLISLNFQAKVASKNKYYFNNYSQIQFLIFESSLFFHVELLRKEKKHQLQYSNNIK